MSSAMVVSSEGGQRVRVDGGEGSSEITSSASSTHSKLPAAEWSGDRDIAAAAVGGG